MERNAYNFFHQTSSPWKKRNDLADDEREKKHKAPAALYTGLLYSGGPVFSQVYLALFSPTEAEPIPRPGVELGVGLERTLYTHIPNKLLKSFSFRGVGFILGNQTLSAGQEIFSELVLLALNLIFSFYLSDSYI